MDSSAGPLTNLAAGRPRLRYEYARTGTDLPLTLRTWARTRTVPGLAPSSTKEAYRAPYRTSNPSGVSLPAPDLARSSEIRDALSLLRRSVSRPASRRASSAARSTLSRKSTDKLYHH